VTESPGRGQAVEAEDPKLRGDPARRSSSLSTDGTAVALALEYGSRSRTTPLRPLLDLLFIRRALRDALRRTLVRFGRELEADAQLLH
jgi:hypothetical protein